MINNELQNIATFHHIGVAVRDFKASVKLYQKLGYTCSEPVIDKLQEVELVMCISNLFPSIELVKPLDVKSPVCNYLKKTAEAFYHLGFTVKNLSKTLRIIEKDHRIFCVNDPKPAILFSQKKVSFYYIPGVALLEFIEE